VFHASGQAQPYWDGTEVATGSISFSDSSPLYAIPGLFVFLDVVGSIRACKKGQKLLAQAGETQLNFFSAVDEQLRVSIVHSGDTCRRKFRCRRQNSGSEAAAFPALLRPAVSGTPERSVKALLEHLLGLGRRRPQLQDFERPIFGNSL